VCWYNRFCFLCSHDSCCNFYYLFWYFEYSCPDKVSNGLFFFFFLFFSKRKLLIFFQFFKFANRTKTSPPSIFRLQLRFFAFSMVYLFIFFFYWVIYLFIYFDYFSFFFPFKLILNPILAHFEFRLSKAFDIYKDTPWVKEWFLCIVQGGGQNYCSEISLPYLPEIVLYTIAEILVALLGVIVFGFFGSTKQVFYFWKVFFDCHIICYFIFNFFSSFFFFRHSLLEIKIVFLNLGYCMKWNPKKATLKVNLTQVRILILKCLKLLRRIEGF